LDWSDPIFTYTIETFGIEQARRYRDGLQELGNADRAVRNGAGVEHPGLVSGFVVGKPDNHGFIVVDLFDDKAFTGMRGIILASVDAAAILRRRGPAVTAVPVNMSKPGAGIR
jgi:hypothetical protein